MRIAIGILGTLLTAFATWILLIWLHFRPGTAGLSIGTPLGTIHINRGNFLIPTPFESLPYVAIPVWSPIVLGALLALWGFLGFGKKKQSLAAFPIETTPQPHSHPPTEPATTPAEPKA